MQLGTLSMVVLQGVAAALAFGSSMTTEPAEASASMLHVKKREIFFDSVLLALSAVHIQCWQAFHYDPA